MKTLLATLGLAALLSPALALADDAPPAQWQAHMAQFQQFHQKMEQLHVQARSQMLAALTPAHREALANIIGHQAIAQNPDPEAAARQINALLSPGEAQSVLRIHDATRAQAESLMQSMRSQMQHSMPPGAPDHPKMMEHSMPHDAGHILLMLAGHGEHEHGMMMVHPGA